MSVSTTTYTSTVTFLPWSSGESLSPSNLNRHNSSLTLTVVVATNIQVTPASSLPISPVMGTVISNGSLASPAVAQLYNPETSTKTLTIYELYVHSPSNAFKVFVRRSSSTLTQGSGASVFTPSLIHLNQSDTTTILGNFRGYNFTTSSLFTETGSHWWGKLPIEGNDGWQPTAIRVAGNFPWSLATGNALEIISSTTGSDKTLVVTAVWDEI